MEVYDEGLLRLAVEASPMGSLVLKEIRQRRIAPSRIKEARDGIWSHFVTFIYPAFGKLVEFVRRMSLRLIPRHI